MAFIQFKLTKSINQERGIFDKYIYSSVTDTIAEVATAGYFNESRFIEEWDKSVIECLCVDGYFIGEISSDGKSASILITSGGGSGDQNGFIDYNDTATALTPITLLADTWTTLTNDGLGAFTNKAYAPTGVTELYDTTAQLIDFSELGLGDVVFIRNDFTVTPNTNNTLLEFRYQLGIGGFAYTLEKSIGRLDSGSGNPYRFSLNVDEIYMGDLNTRDNGGVLQVRLSAAGTLINAGSVFTVMKR